MLRSRIVLLAAQGLSNCQIGHDLDCDLKTVRKWRDRFAEQRLAGLDDQPRSGRPAQFSATQRHEVFATLVGPPPEPYARWTLNLMIAALIEKGIVPDIGRETVAYWLRTADVKPHRCKYWLTSYDPLFEERKNRIVGLYLNPPRDGILLSIDEKTSMQALERVRPEIPASKGRSRRVDFGYKRHGVVNLLAAFVIGTGQVHAQCIEKNDSTTFIRFIRTLMKLFPKGKLYLVLDNGTTHRSKQTTAFFAKHPRLVPVFTPTHASWLNQVEIFFSLLSRQALKNVSFKSRQALRERILGYIEAYNVSAKPFKWSTKGEPLKAGTEATGCRKPKRQRRRSTILDCQREVRRRAQRVRTSVGSK